VPEMPPIVRDLVTFANRLPVFPSGTWKRVRLAVTPDEHEQIRQFFFADSGGQFWSAIRGVPLLVEEHPTHPLISLEIDPARPLPPERGTP